MNIKIVKIGPTDKILPPAVLFADRRFKTLLAVTDSGEFKGTITASDIHTEGIQTRIHYGRSL